jgi:hypothetical protein
VPICIDEANVKQGVLGLVMALLEIIRDSLRLQAMKRMEGGSLTDEEVERLGQALIDLDGAIEEIKREHGLAQVVADVRASLDDIVDDALDQLVNPQRWAHEAQARRT